MNPSVLSSSSWRVLIVWWGPAGLNYLHQPATSVKQQLLFWQRWKPECLLSSMWCSGCCVRPQTFVRELIEKLEGVHKQDELQSEGIEHPVICHSHHRHEPYHFNNPQQPYNHTRGQNQTLWPLCEEIHVMLDKRRSSQGRKHPPYSL